MGIKSFFSRLAATLEEHTVVADYEADLYLLDGDRKGAKAAELEFTRFKPGHTVFEIELKTRSGVPEGDEAIVLIHGVEVARVTKLKLQTEVRLNSKDGDEVPPIRVGDVAEIMHNGVVIAMGEFRKDD